MKYKDKDYLREEILIKNRSFSSVAKENNVSVNVICKFFYTQDLLIPGKPIPIAYRKVKVKCDKCGTEFEKNNFYVKRRGKNARFYCTESCADSAHSQRMKSEGNPNFGGTYHGECSSLWSEEKRKKSIDKMIATFKREGTVAGKKNPKWNGGTKTYPCIVCGTETSPYPPGIWKAIENGERVPACSKRCSLIHGRKNLLEEMTSIEILMMNKLIEHNVEFIPQYSLDDIYFVDFYLPNYNIVIECDGDYWHGNPIRFPNPTKQQLYQINHDKIKNGYIFKKKMKLFRFWECDLNTRLDECFQQVLDKINEVDSPRKKVIK